MAQSSVRSPGRSVAQTAVTNWVEVPARSIRAWLASSSRRAGSSVKRVNVASAVRRNVARRAASSPWPITSPTTSTVASRGAAATSMKSPATPPSAGTKQVARSSPGRAGGATGVSARCSTRSSASSWSWSAITRVARCSERSARTSADTSFWTPMTCVCRPSASSTGASRSSLWNGVPSRR